MSRTPIEASDEVQSYAAGWAAMGWLVRSGLSWSGRERNVAFLGRGDGTFLEAGSALGLDDPADGRSVATVDWDGDGDLDLVLRARSAPRLQVLENRLPRRGNFARFHLIDRAHAIGARLEVRAEGQAPWLRTVRAGEGYLSQSSEWQHVGVGAAEELQVDVRWADGSRESFGSVPAGRSWILVRGDGRAREGAAPGTFAVAGGAPAVPPAPAVHEHILGVPHPLPTLKVRTRQRGEIALGGVLKSRSGRTQKPMLLMVWGADCRYCLEELADWSKQRAMVQAGGLGVVALELPDAEQRGAGLLAGMQWPYADVSAGDDTVPILQGLLGYFTDQTGPLALPLSLLIDGHGRIQVIFQGIADPARVLELQALFALEGPERLRAAMPYDGLFLEPPLEPNWGSWAELCARGA
ncbi:MAG: ASPIC/UnbV domain-containing protein [Planctomycetota bacterium]